MSTSRITLSGDVGGVSIQGTITRSAPGQIAQDPILPAAKAGTLSTRTSDTAGTLTLGAGHGVQTGDKVDLYWAGGCATNATVGTVSGTSVPFTGAAGSVLPAQDTVITVAVQTVIDVDFVANLLVAIAAMCGQAAHLGFYEDTTLRLALNLTANEAWTWFNGGTAANPLAGFTVTKIVATQAAAAAAQLKIGVLYDSA